MSIMTQRIQWTKPAVLMCLLVGLSACGGETGSPVSMPGW